MTPTLLNTAPGRSKAAGFVDRRNPRGETDAPGRERRQFANSHDDLTPDARELAVAIDAYKARHRRRFITFEEMLCVMQSLGYKK